MRIGDIFTEAGQDLGTIISVARIANDKSQGSETPGKMKMSGFLNMLRNSGLAIDYDHFKTLYDTNPELKTAIQQYNDDEVVFSADETGEEETPVTEPEGEVPPEKKVNSMAKAALAKRESVEEVGLDEGKMKNTTMQANKPRFERKGQELEAYANKFGGVDKKDMMKVAAMLKRGDKSGALKYAKTLDTDPKEYIMSLIGEETELDERFRYKIYTGKTYLGKEYGKDEDEAKKNALSGGGAASNWKTKLSSNDLKAIKEEVDLDEANPAKMSDEVLKSRLDQLQKSLDTRGDSPAIQHEIKRLNKEIKKRESVDEDDRGLDISQEPEENPVASAILYRIVRQHPNVFMKYGPEEVMIAAGDVADMVGDVDEIGSSDISIWTRQTIEMLDGMDESLVTDEQTDTAKISRMRKLAGI